MCVSATPIIRRITLIHAGGPCVCAPGRYVRFALPSVPGLTGVISCRDNEGTGPQSIREHEIPRDVRIEKFLPSLDGR